MAVPERLPYFEGESNNQAGWAVLDPERTAAANVKDPTKTRAIYKYIPFSDAEKEPK